MKRNHFGQNLTVAFLLIVFGSSSLCAQQEAGQQQTDEQTAKEYVFTVDRQLDATSVKSQGRTGTCWCFASASFLESELMRMGKGEHDLSEIFVVKNIYNDKARNYVLRQGKANFGEGALAHDCMSAIGRFGVVPEEVYNGLMDGNGRHDHAEMFTVLESVVVAMAKRRNLSKHWDDAFRAVMDVYLGESPQEFSYRGNNYTPQSLAKSLGIDVANYVNLTSYMHHPFGKPFVLEIPDNFSNGSFHNVPIDDLVQTIDRAIEKGYTIAWDGDISERGFSRNKGMAILPKDPNRPDVYTIPGEEIEVTQEMRQETLENFSTTDDHLMHLVGVAHDQKGTKYYIIKNSWGEVGDHNGYLYMSEAYVRLKTVAILVHKDALAEEDDVTTPSDSTVAQDENE